MFVCSRCIKNLAVKGLTRTSGRVRPPKVQVIRHYSTNANDDDRMLDMSRYPPDLIRNFSIIAHIDHGKSTLADRMLELTGTIDTSKGKNKQVLDKLKVERDRGITIKAQTASMFYNFNGKKYLLNLIDTPGHVDFSYEVSRSLAACQGTLLLVDATQGVQAQTVANYFMAFASNLHILPVLNKVDLATADAERCTSQLAQAFEIDTTSLSHVSAKTGRGVEDLLKLVITAVPPPPALPNQPFRGLLFDTWYDTYVGVICLVAISEGVVKRGQRIRSLAQDTTYEVSDLGIMFPEQTPTASLHAGQVGYLIMGIKSARDARVGDTLYAASTGVDKVAAFPGFRPARSMVYAGLFPVDANDYNKLQDALERLTLNDASVGVEKETSVALGQGFRLGFLGTLHMDVFRQRLEEEYDAAVINTAPTVPYKIHFENGSEVVIHNPAQWPEPNVIHNAKEFHEPMVIGTLVFPQEYMGKLMELCGAHRGEQLEYTYIDETRVMMKYRLPMSEVLTGFYDQLKSRSSGYASFDYEECGWQASDLVKVDLLLNGKPVDALGFIVHRSESTRIAREWVKKLKAVMSKELFEVIIQASVSGRVIARESIAAVRKDVLSKCYGGDVTRKMKLLEKQRIGKKRLKTVAGGISLPQEAFLTLMNNGQ
ncbi:hypothetical protein SmJEL517_g00024 [Synchytrium microbalum]|uniref:Tr-type G domain-containing protein n=1 Tax=Synchytrium microbalum TaxID=1806994 RepID=A0A507CEW8_9FUNG|nr:uncharacterized protein SmJEL517_g00024 [Synchytrium microbalum]TPX38031.1 hypothetical protein SmJEL517_g00024 [Synchytrium microbalum]